MSLVGKIVGYVERVYDKYSVPKDRVILELPLQPVYDNNPQSEGIIIAHDYVRFSGSVCIQQSDDCPVKETYGASNWLYAQGSVTISIRDMYDIILPMLNKHKNLQAEHFKRGEEDAYCYNSCIMHFRDQDTRKLMVAFRRTGEVHWETITLDLFNTIKHTLKLNMTKKEFDEHQEEN